MTHHLTNIVYDFNSLLDNFKEHRYIDTNEFLAICFMSVFISLYILSNHSEKVEQFFANIVVKKSIILISFMILLFIGGYVSILSLTALFLILYLISTNKRFVRQKEFLKELFDIMF